jgi:hypothetical protein
MWINALLGETLGSNWLDHFLTSGRGDMHLYHVVFAYLAGMIAFPDRAVSHVSKMLKKSLGLRSVVLTEFGCVVLMIAMTLHIRAIDTRFSSWEPIVLVGCWLLLRGVQSLVCYLADLD